MEKTSAKQLSPPKEKPTNAFELLMGRRETPSVSKCDDKNKSRFVLCPIGCGKHVKKSDINSHLDSCSANIPVDGNSSPRECKKPRYESQPSKLISPDHPSTQSPETGPSRQVLLDEEEGATKHGDAISFMMKRSRVVFAHENKPPLRQRFHLGENGVVSWITGGADDTDFACQVTWSRQVLLKGNRMANAQPDLPLRDAQLEISTSLPIVTSPPSAPGMKRMVRYHSRLSVPVLKSILQKSIRRRKPLPSVKVSMELVDKSLGDLLRRLPIIMLEDAFLHPDLPFMVWLMVALSKDYVVPNSLIHRVLRIVFEMASCPWTDTIRDNSAAASQQTPQSTILQQQQPFSKRLYLSSPEHDLQQEFGRASRDSELIIRSMLMRAQYGGMAGDIDMMHKYIQLWRQRFFLGAIPEDVVRRLSDFRNMDVERSKIDWKWSNVPHVIYEKPKIQSTEHVAMIGRDGLEFLNLRDVCAEGIDFHCSAVLDDTLSDPLFTEMCVDELIRIENQVGCKGTPERPNRAWALGLLKECMWRFSSGVNYRRPLMLENAQKNEGASAKRESLLKEFWQKTLSERIHSYMHKYVADRLSN